MANENEYTDLIAGSHRGKERFTEWIYQLTEPLRKARLAIADFVTDYDIDYAEGDQLDAVGVRVGLSRKLKFKITDVFFAFDDVDGVGFDLGIWQTARDDTYGVTELGDDVYRTVLKAKIALNQYTGKNEALQQLLEQISAAFGITTAQFAYVDSQDMAITIYVDRSTAPPIVWEIFTNDVLTLNHAGVGLTVEDGVAGSLATSEGKILTTDDGDILLMDIK
jgi:hypothetical protein